jgi:hypothetical protein
MALNFKCPTCVAQSLTSTVNVEKIQKDIVITRAFFQTDGSLVPPVVKQVVTTICSQGHTVDNEFNKIPSDILDRLKFFLPS